MPKSFVLNLTNFERDGFALIRAAVSDKQIEDLLSSIERVSSAKSSPGIRHLLTKCPEVKTFANSGVIFEIASSILGAGSKPVRAILFDKTPESNWYVTWHQDVTIAVKERVEIEGYEPWSTKDGILHVQPPANILERMISLRIHFDPCSEENGPIKFIPGSHAAGILDTTQLAHWREKSTFVVCPAKRGDVIIMRPLILHSSALSKSPEHRRVLHVEYAGVQLPKGLNWAEA